jgi:NADPH:quinone reductase-like Zn-dependent oxidoreductase
LNYRNIESDDHCVDIDESIMTKRSASKESKFPWDPLWEFVANDKNVERKVVKASNVLMRFKSREKSIDEIRDEDGSGRLVSGAKTVNETREIPTQTHHGYMELDKSYFDESETDESSVPSNRLDRRKVHFSPFKNVTLVEDFSFEDRNTNLTSARNAGCNDTWDANDIPVAFSLGEFLHTWKEHLVDFDDSTYASSLNLLNTTTTQEHSWYDSAATESFQSFATMSNRSGEELSIHDTSDIIIEAEDYKNTAMTCLEKNFSDCNPSEVCDQRKATDETRQKIFGNETAIDKKIVIGPIPDKEIIDLDDKVITHYHSVSLDSMGSIGSLGSLGSLVRDGQSKDAFESTLFPCSDNQWSRESLECCHTEKILLTPDMFQERSVQNLTNLSHDSVAQPSDASPKGGIAWDEIVPKSLFEYEYDEDLHMFLSFKNFGLEESKLDVLQRLQKPSIPQMEQGSTASSKVVIIVEVSTFSVSRKLPEREKCLSLCHFFANTKASTISHTDALIRQGDWRSPVEISLPCTPGVDFSGRVYEIDPILSQKTGFAVGDQVLSLCTTGGNARYVVVDHQNLVKVQGKIESALATCLPETYLAAFQALHHSQSNSTRYKKSSLGGKAVLIVGTVTSNLGRAVAELSHAAGARVVYGTAELKHYKLLQALKVVPITTEGDECEEVDLIVSLDQEVDFRFSRLLKWYGEIVIICERQILARSKDVVSKPLFCSRKKAQASSKTTRYDVHQQWKVNRELCKKDLTYVLKMLENNEISPYIIDHIPLEKVGKVHEFIGTKRLSGFLVCDPWFEKIS